MHAPVLTPKSMCYDYDNFFPVETIKLFTTSEFIVARNFILIRTATNVQRRHSDGRPVTFTIEKLSSINFKNGIYDAL